MKRILQFIVMALSCAVAPLGAEPRNSTPEGWEQPDSDEFAWEQLESETSDGAARQKILAGEIVLLDTSTDEAGGSARVMALVNAPAKSIWDVIISCEHAFIFVDGLEACEVLEENGDRALVHQVVKRGWPIPTQDFTFESLREPHTEIRFRLVDGNLKAMDGRWRFIDIEEGLLVDYQVRIQPGIPAPKFIVRRNIRNGMPDLIACIRGLAGGSWSVKQESADLASCPGDHGR